MQKGRGTNPRTHRRVGAGGSGGAPKNVRCWACLLLLALLVFLYSCMPNPTVELEVGDLARRTIVTVATVEGREGVLQEALISLLEQRPPPRAILVNYHVNTSSSSSTSASLGPTPLLMQTVAFVTMRMRQKLHHRGIHDELPEIVMLPAEECWKAAGKLLGALDYLYGDELNCRKVSCKHPHPKLSSFFASASSSSTSQAALAALSDGYNRKKESHHHGESNNIEPPPPVDMFLAEVFPHMKREELVLVTADDDIVYTAGWLHALLYQGDRLGCLETTTSKTGASIVASTACVVGTRGWRVRTDYIWGVMHGFVWYVVSGFHLASPYQVGVLTGGSGIAGLVSSWRRAAPGVCGLQKGPKYAPIVDDIWTNGNLARYNVSRFVIPFSGEGQHRTGGEEKSAVALVLSNTWNRDVEYCPAASLRWCANRALLLFFKDVWERHLYYDDKTSYTAENTPSYRTWAWVQYRWTRWWENW